jgi:hypothetical protein
MIAHLALKNGQYTWPGHNASGDPVRGGYIHNGRSAMPSLGKSVITDVASDEFVDWELAIFAYHLPVFLRAR